MESKNLRLVFLGTPAIAVASLDAILQSGYKVVGIVTAPDKPAGRGQKVQVSEVKKYAIEKGLNIMQPENLKSEEFLEELKLLQPDVGVVVAFRMLPEQVWALPPMGTFNLHASLLPHYRGAAPINHAIINGETKTGVTTFFLDKQIDTGKIIGRKEIDISESDTAGTLHDKLMVLGSQLVLETLGKIAQGNVKTISQDQLILPDEVLKKAPKIFREDCRIDWNKPVHEVKNFIRGLNPIPGAFFESNQQNGEILTIKIFDVESKALKHSLPHGKLFSDNKNYIRITTPDGYIEVKSLQASGKKRMQTDDFLRGYAFRDVEPMI